MIVSIDNDSGINVYGIIRDSNDNIANGSATEAYNAANWASAYAITAPEQGSSGHYQITVPSYLTAGVYSVTFYQRTGGSPTPGDPILGSHNFTISSSSGTAPAPVSSLVGALRILGHDTATANLSRNETPKGAKDGANKNFYLEQRNLVVSPNSIYITIGGSTFRQTPTAAGVTVDSANGILSWGSAPSNGAQVTVDYNFYWFTDVDHTQFIADAHRDLGYVYADPTPVPDALQGSLLQFALARYWTRRASQYAPKYASSGGLAGQQVDIVTQNFMKLAKDARTEGIRQRDDYYKRVGQRNAPSSRIGTYKVDPFVPKR